MNFNFKPVYLPGESSLNCRACHWNVGRFDHLTVFNLSFQLVYIHWNVINQLFGDKISNNIRKSMWKFDPSNPSRRNRLELDSSLARMHRNHIPLTCLRDNAESICFYEIFLFLVSVMLYLKSERASKHQRTKKTTERLSNEKYIMSVPFTKNTDKILIVYDRSTHSRRDFLNFVFKQRCDWQPLHMKISHPKG